MKPPSAEGDIALRQLPSLTTTKSQGLSITSPPLALAPATVSVATKIGLAGTATSLVARVDVGEVVLIIVVVDSAVVATRASVASRRRSPWRRGSSGSR
jgi:small-conductance mechanosensitive channel